MNDIDLDSEKGNGGDNGEASARRTLIPAERTGSMRLSMHNGVAVWCDCCSCEAEPYWAAMEETGIDPADPSVCSDKP